jgi:hypothetical protein
MVWLPAARLEVVQVAVPPLSAWAPQVPIVVPPSLKLTVPVGLLPLTVAVKVTDCPNVEGLTEEPRLVAVTTCWVIDPPGCTTTVPPASTVTTPSTLPLEPTVRVVPLFTVMGPAKVPPTVRPPCCGGRAGVGVVAGEGNRPAAGYGHAAGAGHHTGVGVVARLIEGDVGVVGDVALETRRRSRECPRTHRRPTRVGCCAG